MTRILLVEDHPENIEYLATLLQANGFETVEASDGAQALAMARDSLPDLVISDLLMPLMDGYTLLRTWKDDPRLRAIPFIVYTATYTQPEDERLAASLGVDAFFLKPLDPGVFLVHLREVLSRPATRSPVFPGGLSDTEHVVLRQYNDVLIRKLEQKSLQVERSNRELLSEISERGDIAQTQVAILNALPARIALLDVNGLIMAVNDSWRDFALESGRVTSNYGIGQDYLAICRKGEDSCSSESPAIADGIQSVLSGRSTAFSIEYPCATPDRQQWFRMVATPLRNYRPSGAVVMHIDVTDRIGAEDRLRESQQQYLMLLNATAEGIYGLDLQGVCTFCNPAAAHMLGFNDPHEVVGHAAHDHHHLDLDDKPSSALDCRVHGWFRRGEATHGDGESFIRRDGSRFPVEFWTHPIRNGNDIVGAVVTFLDISERRSLEAQFLRSQKMEAIGRLAGGVAHDFNNALQVVMTCSELLEAAVHELPEALGYIREIKAASTRGASLTRQLLAFSRQQTVNTARVNLNDVVEELKGMLRRIIGENIMLHITVDRSDCIVEADVSQVEQVLMNLAVNARDAMPSGGDLFISTSHVAGLPAHISEDPPLADGYVALHFYDTGCGMDSETRSRIFEPFFTTKEPGKGTGLGLPTVYGIVRQSGGFIEVDSSPNQGTRIHIYLPSSPGSVEAGVGREVQAPDRGGTERILLVEDDEPLLDLISKTLRHHRYTVLEARNAHAALNALSPPAARIDLLLTDVILPDISGPQLAAQLVDLDPALKVLFISGYTDDYLPYRAHLGTHTPLLEKPFSTNSLLAKIREVLDQARVV